MADPIVPPSAPTTEPSKDPLSPTVPKTNTDRSFGNMLNESTGVMKKKKMLSSVSDVLLNTNLSRARKIIALKARGFSMAEAEQLVDKMVQTDKPDDIYMDSANPKMKQPMTKKKKGFKY